jgi:hypothetical protein
VGRRKGRQFGRFAQGRSRWQGGMGFHYSEAPAGKKPCRDPRPPLFLRQ